VHRTTKRRAIHNIYASRHVTVTYIMDKRPQSLKHGNTAFRGRRAEDET
jgi:hypothetical protein